MTRADDLPSAGPRTASAEPPRRSWRWIFGAIWLVFLTFPLAAVLDARLSVTGNVVGFGLIGVFAAFYLVACVRFFGDLDRRESAPGVDDNGVNWLGVNWLGVILILALCAITVAMLPLVHNAAFGLAPFLVTSISFVLPIRPAVVAIMVIVAATLVIPSVAGWDIDLSVVSIVFVVGVGMIVLRAVREREQVHANWLDEQRRLDRRMAVVAERERVARDVHDILGHSLTVISIKSELAGRLVDLDPGRAKDEIAELNSIAREALSEVRLTVGRLRSPDLADQLASAASALAAAGIRADVPAPEQVETEHPELFAWVLREAVTNVIRHSGAKSCRVRFGATSISISDDGTGSAMLLPGNGLRGLSERAAAVGGELRIDSSAEGTTVTALVADAAVPPSNPSIWPSNPSNWPSNGVR